MQVSAQAVFWTLLIATVASAVSPTNSVGVVPSDLPVVRGPYAPNDGHGGCGAGSGCTDVPGVVDEGGDIVTGPIGFEGPLFVDPSGAFLESLDAGPMQFSNQMVFADGTRLHLNDAAFISIDNVSQISATGANLAMPVSMQDDFVMESGTSLLIAEGAQLLIEGNISDFSDSDLTIDGNIVPAVDDSYSLGTDALRWATLYMASVVDIRDDLTVTSAGSTLMVLSGSGDLEVAGDLAAGEKLLLAGQTLEVVGGQLLVNGAIVCTTAGNCPPADLSETSRILGRLDEEVGRVTLRAGTPGVALCWVDRDGTGKYEGGDDLYVKINQDNCQNGVLAGHVRLTANDAGAALTRVASGDADLGRQFGATGATTNTAGLASRGAEIDYHDANGNGIPDRADAIYADVDDSGAVSAGDYRWTPAGGAGGGTVVGIDNPDFADALSRPGTGGYVGFDAAFKWWDLDADGTMDMDDPAYLDMDDTDSVTAFDVRLFSVAHV